jgi:hypothetical protein
MKGRGGEWGRGVMRGKNTREKGTFFWREHYFHIRRLYWGILIFFLGDWKTVLLVLAGEACGRTVTRGHLLLGVLGLGARNPYGILELGSRRGSVPSWLGG